MTGQRITEDELLEGILGGLAGGGWLYQHTRRSDLARIQGNHGIPDITAVHADRRELVFLELKTATGRVEEWQQRWIDALRQARTIEARIVRPADYDETWPWLVGDRLIRRSR